MDIVTTGTELSQLQLRAVFRLLGYLQIPPPATDLSAIECWRLWICMLINRLKFLAPEQRSVLMEIVLSTLPELSLEAVAGQTPVVVIADSRYATWHGYTGWFDLQTGEDISAIPGHPLETIAYSLIALFHRNHLACAELKRRKERQDAASNTG